MKKNTQKTIMQTNHKSIQAKPEKRNNIYKNLTYGFSFITMYTL